MRTLTVAVFVLGMLALVVAGCSSGPAATPTPSGVALGQSFQLEVGQSQSISGEDLSLKLVAITADSRCPIGAECIQAGQAVAQVQVTSKGQVSTRELVETGLTQSMTTAEMGTYHLAFQILPYPEVGKTIKPSDYRLVLTVTR